MNVENNAVSDVRTAFLAGPSLIRKAMQETGIPSENWAYPVGVSVGSQLDPYFAEVWRNGMDWQSTYWALEKFGLSNPRATLLLIRDGDEAFNRWDLENLLRALLVQRRATLFGGYGDPSIYHDTAWCWLKRTETVDGMVSAEYSHASQKPVAMRVNSLFLPVPEPVIP